MNSETIYKVEIRIDINRVKTISMSYQELMSLFCDHQFHRANCFKCPYYFAVNSICKGCSVANSKNLPCGIFYNGERLSKATLQLMIDEYKQFTEPSVSSANKDDLNFRRAPVPYTGAVTSRGGLRSKEVLRNGCLQFVQRSNMKNYSWKSNCKARKAWGKHLPGSGRKARTKMSFEDIEESLNLFDEYDGDDLNIDSFEDPPFEDPFRYDIYDLA